MKVVKFVSSVDPSKCSGDKLCERVCPTGAIHVIDKEAHVDEEQCVACSKCWDRCPSDAIEMVPRAEPVLLRTDPVSVDQEKTFELCFKAKVLSGQLVCMCTGTLAKEVAAAIGHKETAEVIEHFQLKEKFDKIRSFGPWDKGVPIETEIGTLYGVARAHEADWFLHAYYDDPRKMYFHRYGDRRCRCGQRPISDRQPDQEATPAGLWKDAPALRRIG